MTDFNFQPKGEKSDFGWYSRGYLPHFDGGEVTQFITLRLFDSLPLHVVEKMRATAKNDVEYRKRVERYLDAGYGKCWLKDERIADLLEENLKFHDGQKYRLSSWVVMPNHVHFLVTPLEGNSLSSILHTLKSYTAHEANKILGRSGQFWQLEAFDRYIRNEKHFSNTVIYIEENPVKAELCEHSSLWKYSSAYNLLR
jgi:putative DNA methylase